MDANMIESYEPKMGVLATKALHLFHGTIKYKVGKVCYVQGFECEE